MAISASTTSLLLVFLMGFAVYSSHAQNHVFHVGKRDGWTLLPSESYSHWARRNRFQINDELVFKYSKGNDSVLVVGEDDYNKCNKKNPIQTLIDGYSKFKFNRSGPFFFISGHDQNCENGQKLIVVVLAAEHRRHRHPPSSAPSPAKSPAHAPPSHSPSPATYKPAPPLSHSPSPSPTHAPPSHSPTTSPTAQTPTHAPPASPPTPANTPAHAPPTQPPSSPPAHSHQSPPPEAESPDDDAPDQPDADANPPMFLPPHHAPAPAPASASGSGASFILTVGLAIISAWIVV